MPVDAFSTRTVPISAFDADTFGPPASAESPGHTASGGESEGRQPVYLGRPKPFSYRGYEGLVMVATSERDDPEVGLKAHSTSPERTVFTEPDNSDGWIATDYTVGIER